MDAPESDERNNNEGKKSRLACPWHYPLVVSFRYCHTEPSTRRSSRWFPTPAFSLSSPDSPHCPFVVDRVVSMRQAERNRVGERETEFVHVYQYVCLGWHQSVGLSRTSLISFWWLRPKRNLLTACPRSSLAPSLFLYQFGLMLQF